jgi:hypothetical protein
MLAADRYDRLLPDKLHFAVLPFGTHNLGQRIDLASSSFQLPDIP